MIRMTKKEDVKKNWLSSSPKKVMNFKNIKIEKNNRIFRNSFNEDR